MSVGRGVDRQVVVHKRKGISLSREKGCETEPRVEMRMDLDFVTREEVSQKERNNYHILRNTCGIFKNDPDEPVCRAGIEVET